MPEPAARPSSPAEGAFRPPAIAPDRTPEAGPLLFARYAFRPNELGYCGGDDARSLFDHVRESAVDPDLLRLERGFEGALPYLELIARSNGIDDPLERGVVEAYWIGNELLDRVSRAAFASDLEARFRARTARGEWPWLAGKPFVGARPHHSFHVLEILPRIGLLRGDQAGDLLETVAQCAIRPARILELNGPDLLVAVRPIELSEGRLRLGPARPESIRRSLVHDEREMQGGFVDDAEPGDWIAIHWGWACDRLSPGQRGRLARRTTEALALANATL